MKEYTFEVGQRVIDDKKIKTVVINIDFRDNRGKVIYQTIDAGGSRHYYYASELCLDKTGSIK